MEKNFDFLPDSFVENDMDGEIGAIRRPVTTANSYTLPYDPSEMNWRGTDKSRYTRNGGSNQKYLNQVSPI
jgi:methionine-gamma-lyase